MKNQLQQDLKTALRQGDDVRKRTLRMLLAAIKNAEIEAQSELSQADILGIIQKEAKKRQETLAELAQLDRPDMVAAETAELEVLQGYLPKQLSRDEIVQIAQQAIADLGATSPKQMGQVMGNLMPQVKGRADGKLVSQVVRELLSG
jgi:uncharacterized protein YqeY